MSAHKEDHSEKGLRTMEGLREENKWLKALIQLQAARIRVLEDSINPKASRSLESKAPIPEPRPPSPE